MSTRKDFLQYLMKTAMPVLTAGSRGQLSKRMPIEQKRGAGREACSVLEAVGRLVCGIAPWLEVTVSDPMEQIVQDDFREKTRRMILHQMDPESEDYAGFDTRIPEVRQLLVDLAFLAQGMLRAPVELIDRQPLYGIERILNVMEQSRQILPYNGNWILFSSMIEALIERLSGEHDPVRVAYGFRQFDEWYLGDGIYGDGPNFAMDYYNSYVIQPMLMDLCDYLPEEAGERRERILRRAARYGQQLERMIAPDGTFFAVGRSLCYRAGAFHHLAALALHHRLPEPLNPGQVREALYAVITKTLGDESFDDDGFLRIGLCGSQPSLGEGYISTGSLYLCMTAFLVLGLPEDDPFWSDEGEDWTQKKLWRGTDLKADHALEV